MSGFPRGMLLHTYPYTLFKLWIKEICLTRLCNITRIENHAEHGGTLNEHQLNRLVSFSAFCKSSSIDHVQLVKQDSFWNFSQFLFLFFFFVFFSFSGKHRIFC